MNDGDAGDVCVEVKAADEGNATSEDEAPGIKKPHRGMGRLGKGKVLWVRQAGKER